MAFHIDAAWDDSAGVWIATSGEVPGLRAEADSLDALIAVVLELVSGLLAANGVAAGAALDHVPIRVVTERMAVAHCAA